MSGVLSTWFFLFSFVPWFLIDRIGRKPLFLIGTSGQMVAMVVQTGMIYMVENHPSEKQYGIIASLMLFIFLGSFTFGMQSTVWVYPTEIIPLNLRSKGAAISTGEYTIFEPHLIHGCHTVLAAFSVRPASGFQPISSTCALLTIRKPG